MKNCFALAAFLLLLTSCLQDPPVKPGTEALKFFDLRSYFDAQATQLQQRHAVVQKSVTKDAHSESKTQRIDRWKRELGMFSGADINKPAWRSSYTTVKKGPVITYLATDPKLRTRSVRIQSAPGGKVAHIRIENRSDNYLYHSREVLDFFPDSLYRVSKQQQVLLLGTTHYLITGKIIQ